MPPLWAHGRAVDNINEMVQEQHEMFPGFSLNQCSAQILENMLRVSRAVLKPDPKRVLQVGGWLVPRPSKDCAFWKRWPCAHWEPARENPEPET